MAESRESRRALQATAIICGLLLLGAAWHGGSGRRELVGASNLTPSQFVVKLGEGQRSQHSYLSDSENPAGLMASETPPGGRLWARVEGSMGEEGALSSLEERAQSQAERIAQRRRQGSHLPRYQSVEESALASIAAQAERQLTVSQQMKKRGRRRPNIAGPPIAMHTQLATSQSRKRARFPAGASTNDDLNEQSRTLRAEPHSSHSETRPATIVHASGPARGKARVKTLANIKLRSAAKFKETQRQEQLARIALLDDDKTASRKLKRQKSQILRLIKAASTSIGGKGSAGHAGKNDRVGSKLLWPGESDKGAVQVASNNKRSREKSAPTSSPTAASPVAKARQAAKGGAEAGGASLAWPGEAKQDIKWPGERGYARPATRAGRAKGDRLAWPDGHSADAAPLQPGPNAATQAGWHGGGWKDLNTEWSWPQESAAPVSEGVESQLNLVLLIDGATQASMKTREQGIFEAAVADAAGVSLQQLHVDYAVDVPGLLGHMEVSLRMVLSPGLSCGAVAARVRDSVQTGKLNSLLADFGASGLAVSLLNMSGCPAAMMPAPAPLPSQAGSAPAVVGPTGSNQEDIKEGYQAVARGRSGLTSDEAVEAAQQVATQTAQQVASEVATASAADTAQQLEGELRTLAQKVAKATATKVAHDILKNSAARASHLPKSHPSALKELEAAAAGNAAERYGP